jgi:lipopolysaccharide export system permease protein
MKDSATNKKANTLRNAELQADFLYSSLLATTNMIETTKKRKNQYIVEIQKKYSIPFACLIFVLIGAPLGIVIRRGNFGVSAIFSLGFYIFYWIFLMSGEKLADRDFLSPVLGMWLGNIVISVFAIFLIIRVNFETFNITAILPLKKNRTNLK